MSDPQNPTPPAPVAPVEHVAPPAPAPIPPPASTAATASSPAPAPSAPAASSAPAQAVAAILASAPTSAATAATASPSATLGKILTVVSSVLVGLTPALPLAGAVTIAVDAAEGGLRALAEWLTTKGSLNQDTEAQAEAALTALLAGLATLAAPLPTPEAIEAGPGA
jgi:hypothetical protein